MHEQHSTSTRNTQVSDTLDDGHVSYIQGALGEVGKR